MSDEMDEKLDRLAKQYRNKCTNSAGVSEYPMHHFIAGWNACRAEMEAEVREVREALEKIAKHDLQAIALTALRASANWRSGDKENK